MATASLTAARVRRALWADARVRAWVWLALIVLAVAVAGGVFVTHLASFFVMTDEMSYWKGSSDVYDMHRLLHPGDTYFLTWGQLAPLVRAPVFALSRTTTAFDAAHLLNVVAYASSGVPIYLLAQRVLSWRPGALLAAALSVCIPWMALTGTMLTEAMTYPAFCWALFAMHRAVAAPSWRADLFALAMIGLAFFGRTQFAILGGSFVLAVVAHEMGRAIAERRVGVLWPSARRHVILLAAVAFAAAVYVAVGKDRILSDALGSYTQTAYGALIPPGTRAISVEMVGLVGIACGVIPLPLALAWTGRSLVRPGDREAHAFACLAWAVGGVLTIVVGSYVLRFTAGPGMADRYLFYLAPLMFIGMLGCLLTMRRSPLPLLAGGVAAFLIYKGHALLENKGSPVSPAAPFHSVINHHVGAVVDRLGLGLQPATALGLAALVGSALLAVPRHLIPPRWLAGVVGGCVLAFCAYETAYTLRDVQRTQTSDPGYLAQRDWVDRALPDGASAPAVLGEVYDKPHTDGAWWELLFFNRSVRLSYKDLTTTNEAWGQTSVQEMHIDRRSGAIQGLEAARYVVRSIDDRRWTIDRAREVTRVGNLALQQVPADKRVPWMLQATDEAGRIGPGKLGTLTQFRSGALRLTLAPTGPRKARLRVTGARGTETVAVPGTVVVRGRATRGSAPVVGLRALGGEVQVTGVRVVSRTARAASAGRP